MNITRLKAGRCLSGMVSLALMATASAAPAQQIMSVVESEPDGDAPIDRVVVTTAGQLASINQAGVDTRVLTDYGVNKIYSSSPANAEQFAASAWLDSYTVGGDENTMVNVTFNFSIDGMADFSAASEASFNFSVYALRGNNWSFNGIDGENHDRMFVEMWRPDGGLSQMNVRDFDGFSNFLPNPATPGEPGNFASHVQLIGSGPASYYSLETNNGLTEQRLYATHYETYQNGAFVAGRSGTYDDGNPLSAIMNDVRNGKNGLVANYSLLDMAVMCAGSECGAGIYPGTDLSISFSVAGGSTFSLASILFIDDLSDGTIDLFNTAKVTSVEVTQGVSLSSTSGALGLNSDGSYGYPAAISAPAVPEPTTWAMLIAGLAMVGGLMRRRAPAFAAAA